MLWPGLQPTLEERPVVDRQIRGKADGRRGKDPKEQPALPVVERAGRPEDEEDKKEGPEHSFDDRLTVDAHCVFSWLPQLRRSPTALTDHVVNRMNAPGTNASHGSVASVACAW